MENLGENASINGHREGLAHAHVVERLSIDDKAIVIAPELWHALETGQLGEALFFQNRDAVVVNEIELALFVHGQGCRLLIDHEHLDFFHSRLAEKEIRIGAELDLIFMLPGGEQERAVRHDVARFRPFGSELLDDILALGVGDLKSGDGDEIGGRVFQFHLQRRVVLSLDAQQRLIADLSLVVFLRVQDVEEDIGILGSGFWIQQALPRILEVLGSDFLSIAPGDVIPEMENDPLAPFEDIPGFCYHRRGS